MSTNEAVAIEDVPDVSHVPDSQKEGSRIVRSRLKYICACVLLTVILVGLFALGISLQLLSFISGLCFRLLGVDIDVCSHCSDPLQITFLLDDDNPLTASVSAAIIL